MDLMNIEVNGAPRRVRNGETVHGLLSILGLSSVQIAVERNLEIVPSGAWDHLELQEGDRIEIISFVGGG